MVTSLCTAVTVAVNLNVVYVFKVTVCTGQVTHFKQQLPSRCDCIWLTRHCNTAWDTAWDTACMFNDSLACRTPAVATQTNAADTCLGSHHMSMITCL